MSRLIVIALLFIIAGCGDVIRNRAECRKVADLIEGLSSHDLRVFDQLEDLSTQETMLFAVLAGEGATDPYSRCLEINR